MRPVDELQKLIVQSTASIDQYWETFEVLYPYVCELSHGVPHLMDEQYREVARLCCQLVSWELALRVLKKNRTTKCTIKYSESGSSIVELLTSHGFETFVVPDSEIIHTEAGDRLKIASFKTPDGFHQVYLPKAGINRAIYALIPETEVIEDSCDYGS